MDRVDILIPGAIGLLLVLRPTAFYKPSDSAEADATKAKRLRSIGGVLIGVAVLFLAIRLLSPS